MPEFDAFEPFASETLLKEVVDGLAKSEYKLYGPRPVVFHRGRPNKYAFDLNLGVVHSPNRTSGASARSSCGSTGSGGHA